MAPVTHPQPSSQTPHCDHSIRGNDRITVAPDPTRTQRIREKFIQAFNSRWRDVRGDIRTTIDRNDALELLGAVPQQTPFRAPTEQFRPDSFGVTTDAARQEAFGDWLVFVLRRRIVSPHPGKAVRGGAHYTNTHLQNAYFRGYQRAGVALRKAGYDVDDSRPTDIVHRTAHERALEKIRWQTFHDISVAVDAAKTAVIRELESMLRATAGVREIGDALTEQITTVGARRTELVAQTRAIAAVNHAALVRYQQSNVERATVIVEESDDSACDRCSRLGRQQFPITAFQTGDAPFPPLDTHPRCRCFIVPAE